MICLLLLTKRKYEDAWQMHCKTWAEEVWAGALWHHFRFWVFQTKLWEATKQTNQPLPRQTATSQNTSQLNCYDTFPFSSTSSILFALIQILKIRSNTINRSLPSLSYLRRWNSSSLVERWKFVHWELLNVWVSVCSFLLSCKFFFFLQTNG